MVVNIPAGSNGDSRLRKPTVYYKLSASGPALSARLLVFLPEEVDDEGISWWLLLWALRVVDLAR